MDGKLVYSEEVQEDQNFSIASSESLLYDHWELIAALTSGVLILIGWLLSAQSLTSASVVLFASAYLIGGFAKAKEGITETIEERKLNVELLMVLAAIGSAIIGYWLEGALLIFIFSMSGALETYTLNKSKKTITSLLNLKPSTALRIDGEQLVEVKADLLSVDDRILVRPGEQIPADGLIEKGNTTVDQSTITGESMPVQKGEGDTIYTGTVNESGTVTVRVTHASNETMYQRIVDLVQTAQNERSESQQFIERFEGIYVNIVLMFVGVMLFLPHYLIGWSWTETFYRAMILLVVASPCAVMASIAPAVLSTLSNGARKGVLLKGGNHLSQLAKVDAIAFDKTGTLTFGRAEVTDLRVREDLEDNEILQAVASIESYSSHPLAEAFVHAAKERSVSISAPDSMESITGNGVRGIYKSKHWIVGKASFVGSGYESFYPDETAQFMEEGKTLVYARDEQGIAAVFAIKDRIREDSKHVISKLKDLGITTIMLTGDSEATGQALAKEAGIDNVITECLPEDKVEQIKRLKDKFGLVGMVGDGINDAPALAIADIGIAMGRGTDVALETADVVLMNDQLSNLPEVVRISKKMTKIIKQNLIFSVIVILSLIASNFVQMIDLPLGVIGHEGSTILVILNSLRLLKT
ncbi:heavy metal translocating P-type ATPase [Pseudalkalibacillus berkeleyi]|uniref:Heavy metal translocating P-type ATPase n=1 Tax=Pseudalkalibacillus berkeleyi TaxID=1069813 RepID=A0ABS9H125_9BACL|nr:heavy metal translocating P-type ATPase [Pseudalkalibacillus berkeleyi]MCF6138703.1 heavy metal translocating P-type ATPase [Pseudalkalibacillus berkeleyi]